VAELVVLNPWLDGNCTANLYADLVNDAERAVCVKSDESSSTAPSTTATSPSSTASTPTGSSATCSKEYTVVSGDSCAAIESEFGITFAQFYSWNPDIGSNCEYLQIGKQYCVAGPATSSSTTTAAPSSTTIGTAPTQTGIISTCKTYYTAVEGDSCWSIEQAYGISAGDFVSWNPAVGEDCSGLWLGYSYCVGV
jgi:LysM repeat protein